MSWFERMEKKFSEAANEELLARQSAALVEEQQYLEILESLHVGELLENVRQVWGYGEISLNLQGPEGPIRWLEGTAYSFQEPYDYWMKPVRSFSFVRAVAEREETIPEKKTGYSSVYHGESGHYLGTEYRTGEPERRIRHKRIVRFGIALRNSYTVSTTYVGKTPLEVVVHDQVIYLKDGLYLGNDYHSEINCPMDPERLESAAFSLMKRREESLPGGYRIY